MSIARRFAVVAVVAGCKASPEPAPAEASAPETPAEAAPPASAPPSPVPPAAESPSGAALGSGTLHYGEATKALSVRAGERFGVALESNVTLPFKWRLEPPDAKVVTLVEEKQHETPPPGCGDCVGTSGTKVFSFEAKSAGNASLHFALKPLSNPAGQSQKDVTIAVTVTP